MHINLLCPKTGAVKGSSRQKRRDPKHNWPAHRLQVLCETQQAQERFAARIAREPAVTAKRAGDPEMTPQDLGKDAAWRFEIAGLSAEALMAQVRGDVAQPSTTIVIRLRSHRRPAPLLSVSPVSGDRTTDDLRPLFSLAGKTLPQRKTL